MSNSLSKNLGLTEGRTYIISRKGPIFMEGHIYINSPTVSSPHAELKIKNGRVYLRDLDSTNGIYIMESDGLVSFEEGYVKPNQPIVIGNVKCTVYSLLAFIRDNPALKIHSSNLEDSTQLVIPTIPHYETSDPDIRPLQR